jgi:hypothetical protein
LNIERRLARRASFFSTLNGQLHFDASKGDSDSEGFFDFTFPHMQLKVYGSMEMSRAAKGFFEK